MRARFLPLLACPLFVGCDCAAGGTATASDVPCDGSDCPEPPDTPDPDDEEDPPVPPDECGNGEPDCHEDCVGEGEGCEDFDPDEEGRGVTPCEGDPDCITLGGEAVSLGLIWIANSAQGTVSRVNTRTREEEGRYYTGTAREAADCLGCTDPHGGLSPSRTTVTPSGDVIVGNRNFGRVASATRILATDCPDRDGDGRMETSTGGDDVLEFEDHDDWEDECIAWHTDVGPENGIARGMAAQQRFALDGVPEEYVWVGLYGAREFHEIDVATGAPTGVVVDVAPATPYGAAIDGEGNLWCATYGFAICRFDTADPDEVELIDDRTINYGITVDENGNVWLGGQPRRYEPETGTFTSVDVGWTATHMNWVAGVAADGDGSVWMAHAGGSGEVYRVDAETVEVTSTIATGTLPYGMAVDFDGKIWGIGIGEGHGHAAVIDPETEEVEIVLDECEGGCLDFPYTYSDMTGFQLHTATHPSGEYTHLFEGCEEETTWTDLAFDVDTPPATTVEIFVRTGDTLGALAGAEWIRLGVVPPLVSPVAVDEALDAAAVPHGQYLETRFLLRSLDRLASPRLHGFSMQRICGRDLR